ncbi:putative RNA-directed DNA polymerase [Cucumis melo var. makuwa]|uniref:RNA-directed DNA polymerase n=1 Tax=Cucumis melo var. makuwa TaxID=1194695 RepID=A0A5A7U6Y0_CUCMM|nr:putative RNA-directed DNA polymerase [Cucumis melo var. makuwa]
MQSLIKASWFKFKKIEGKPNVNQNPLPNQEGPAINVVDTFTERYKNKEKVGCANKKQCLFHTEIDDQFSPFAYKDNIVVPWKYECQFITDNVVSAIVGGMTRSGRCNRRKLLIQLSIGQPWIHSVGAVPSSLHQRLKFNVEGGQAIVFGEEDMFVTKISTLPYVEAEEAVECSYRSFEIANATIFPTECLNMDHYVSETSLMIAKTMIKSGFQMHKGLGKDNRGDLKLIFLPKAKEKFGLGYNQLFNSNPDGY